MRTKPFLLGLSAGIVGGLATAIFTAPQSGNQLRSNIVNNTRECKLTLNELAAQTKAVGKAFSSLKYEVKNNIPKVFSELKTSFSNYKEEIKPDSIKLKEELEELQKSIIEIENNLSKIRK